MFRRIGIDFKSWGNRARLGRYETNRVAAAIAALSVGTALAGPALAADDKPAIPADEAKAKQAYALGVQTYIWG